MHCFVPVNDPQALWNLQVELLELAQRLLGPRDSCVEVGRPTFHAGVPYTRLTIRPPGANAVLSPNAAGFLPTAVYELAHETVHLLDPVARELSSFLEQGVAVEFSLSALEHYGFRLDVPGPGRYQYALNRVRSLSRAPLSDEKTIRGKIGVLSKATVPDLATIFPELPTEHLSALCEKFPSS